MESDKNTEPGWMSVETPKFHCAVVQMNGAKKYIPLFTYFLRPYQSKDFMIWCCSWPFMVQAIGNFAHFLPGPFLSPESHEIQSNDTDPFKCSASSYVFLHKCKNMHTVAILFCICIHML